MHFSPIQSAFIARFSRHTQHTAQRTLFARAALRAQLNSSNACGQGNKSKRRLLMQRAFDSFNLFSRSIKPLV